MTLEETLRDIVRSEVREAVDGLRRELAGADRPAKPAEAPLSAEEVAAHCHSTPSTVCRWIRDGELRATRAGHRYLVERADLDAFLGRGGQVAVTGPDEADEVLSRIGKHGRS